MTINAAAVSRALRIGGLRPLPSGTSRMREGVRVSRTLAGGRNEGPVRVAVDVDNATLERRLAADVAAILTEAGFTFTTTADGAVFYVTGKDV